MDEFSLDTKSKNERGLLLYPKWVTDTNGNRVRANNIEHELMLTGQKLEEEKKEEDKEIKPVASVWGNE